jgi:hypothetical protein
MKAALTAPGWSGNVLHGELHERNQRRGSPDKAKSFDTLVARYYPAVYSFACRFTDDPRKAGVLTRDAFISTRKQLRTCCDENVLASILISNVIRAGLPLESNLTKTVQLKRRNNNFGRRYGAHGRTVTGLFQAAVRAAVRFDDSMKQSRPNKREPFILSSPNTANISHR